MNIKLKNNKKFNKNTHLGLFYAIVDIYQNAHSPINDSEMVVLLLEHYGLEVERRTIKRYRDFIEEYFDVIFIHKDKGHYIVEKKDLEKIKEQKKIDIISNALDNCGDYSLNIKYQNNHYNVYPLEINCINDEHCLLCAYQDKYEQIHIINIPIKDIKLLNPLYIESEFNVDKLLYEHRLSLIGELETIEDINPYNLDAKLILKENAPIRDIRKRAKSALYDVKITSVTINDNKYYQLSFYGDHIDVVKFVINNLKNIKEIKSKYLKDEIKIFLGI